ncbi:MAG TPA: hypothetical protein VF267_11185 [Gammaproteobacteria bacterium]
MQNPRQLPEEIDPWKAITALKGVAMAIEWLVTEGPCAEQPVPRDAEIALHGLVHASRLFADQVHDWLERADKAGIDLRGTGNPETESGIRETPADYRLN